MPLDGLRAWIGEVERKLGMRTRVFLVLATIAIGGAGAAIYLAIDTRDDAVSESDVRELQERLETQSGTTGAATTDPRVTQLETELKALEAEVDRLKGDGNAAQSDKGEGANSGGETAAGADLDSEAAKGKLGDLLEEAKEQNRKAEEEAE